MNISGSRILVTGGAGLIGSHIVDELVKEDVGEIIVYDNLARGRSEHLDFAREKGKITLLEADMRDEKALEKAVEGCDFVFHQAASWLRQCQAEPQLSLDVTIIGTFNLLDYCVKHDVKKVIAASSSSVYGESSYLPTDEKHPFNNDLFYGAAKVCNEQHYRSFYKKYDLDYVAFRYLNIYGPRQPFEAAYMDVIMHFFNRIEAGEAPIVRGDGSATVDLVFVEDCAKANVLALKSDITDEAFNVASGRETSLTELAEAMIRVCGKEGELKPHYEDAMDKGLVTRRCGCPKKAKEMLGFKTTTTLEDGLKATRAWRERVHRRPEGAQSAA
jgi:UDP-glucose 4-epimerase